MEQNLSQCAVKSAPHQRVTSHFDAEDMRVLRRKGRWSHDLICIFTGRQIVRMHFRATCPSMYLPAGAYVPPPFSALSIAHGKDKGERAGQEKGGSGRQCEAFSGRLSQRKVGELKPDKEKRSSHDYTIDSAKSHAYLLHVRQSVLFTTIIWKFLLTRTCLLLEANKKKVCGYIQMAHQKWPCLLK